MNAEHQIASRLATTKEAEALIAGDLRRALEQAFREGQLAAPSATNPYAAPKSKPAWHDAVAVIAHTDKNGQQVWERCGGHWDGTAGDEALDSDLRDVTPLIEAKVTVKAVARVADALHDLYGTHDNSDAAAEVIAAALGLDPA